MDGGIYDNYADVWPRGFATLASRFPQVFMKHDCDVVPRQLILINATQTAGFWKPAGGWALLTELDALFRVIAVILQAALEPRKQPIVAGVLGSREHSLDVSFVDQSIPGTLIQNTMSPWEVVDIFIKDRPTEILTLERSERAQRVAAILEPTGDRTFWKKLAVRNSNIMTMLHALGDDPAADLLFQGYYMALTTLHIVFNYPLPEDLPTLDGYREMLYADGFDEPG